MYPVGLRACFGEAPGLVPGAMRCPVQDGGSSSVPQP